MTTTSMTTPSTTVEAPSPPRRRDLRHPLEIPALIGCVVANALIIAFAIDVVWFGSSWITRHPALAQHVTALRTIATAGILALPATVVGRHVGRHLERGNGIRLSPAQLPACHELLVKACRRLGVEQVPDLYLVPRSVLEGMSASYSVFGKRSVVALSAELFGKEWEKNERAIAFAIGHAVGALRLGHTRWWLEMLTTYATRVPFVRAPVRAVFTFSRDRCGAFVEPDGILGLIIHAAGKELARGIDVPSFVDQAMSYGGFWSWVAGAYREKPHLLVRARLLYEAKLFDYARDVARPANAAP